MGVVVLLVVVFFWPSTEREPRVVAIPAPSAAVCQAARAKVAADLQAQSKEVRLVRASCLGVSGDADAI